MASKSVSRKATRSPKGRGVGKKKPAKRALAKAREMFVVPSQDVADAEDIVRHMSTEDLARGSSGAQALAIIQATQQASASEQLAYGAFLDLLDTDKAQAVREDDGTVWMFVANSPSPDRWRGAIRERDGVVERSWFVPSDGKIIWEKV